MTEHRSRALAGRWSAFALAFALVFPAVLTWVYFIALASVPAPVPQFAYGVGKVIQFGFPVFWIAVSGQRGEWPFPPTSKGIAAGVSLGLAVTVATGVVFHWLEPMSHLAGPAQVVRAKMMELGIDGLGKYLGLAIVYSILHSGLEEYYWRWFVFGGLRARGSLGVAIAVSSLGFMAHHVILLGTYFGWDTAPTYLLSLGVASGGAAWAWIYESSGSLLGPWLSHLLVDAAIFWMGYELLEGALF